MKTTTINFTNGTTITSTNFELLAFDDHIEIVHTKSLEANIFMADEIISIVEQGEGKSIFRDNNSVDITFSEDRGDKLVQHATIDSDVSIFLVVEDRFMGTRTWLPHHMVDRVRITFTPRSAEVLSSFIVEFKKTEDRDDDLKEPFTFTDATIKFEGAFVYVECPARGYGYWFPRPSIANIEFLS